MATRLLKILFEFFYLYVLYALLHTLSTIALAGQQCCIVDDDDHYRAAAADDDDVAPLQLPFAPVLALALPCRLPWP